MVDRFKKKTFWGAVALQCCISFCTAKSLSSMYIPSFLDFLPTEVTTELPVP